jgi:hypothetical protein
MSKKRKKASGNPATMPVKPKSCAWCGRMTKTRPGSTSSQMSRYPHSTSKRGVPPLCVEARKMMVIQHRIMEEADASRH